MKKIHILGLGESLSTYKPDEFETFGVNDIWKKVHTDYLLCIDFPKVFTEERRKIILASKPKIFFSHLDGSEVPREENYNWTQMPNFKKITFGSLLTIESGEVPKSNNSTYCAVCIAYQIGYEKIIMHGVDFKNHHQLNKNGNFEKAMRDFKTLYDYLKSKNINLFVSSKISSLSDFIPVGI